MQKTLITAITGQVGAYLAEFLLEEGYDVRGIKRRSSLFNTERIDRLYQDPHKPRSRVTRLGVLARPNSVIKELSNALSDIAPGYV